MSFLSNLFGPAVSTISALELQEKLKYGKHPLLLDVRQPEEFRQGHIAGAKLISLGDLRRSMQELPKDKEIICVCASGSRSRSATKFLVNAGHKAFNLEGGMFMWERAHLPVRKGGSA